MSWLVLSFAVLAAWVMLTIVTNERRRLADANAALIPGAALAGDAAAASAPASAPPAH